MGGSIQGIGGCSNKKKAYINVVLIINIIISILTTILESKFDTACKTALPFMVCR
jgi:hypothetical protein